MMELSAPPSIPFKKITVKISQPNNKQQSKFTIKKGPKHN